MDTLPADFFPAESFDTLASYCRSVCVARRLSNLIDNFKDEWLAQDAGLDRYSKLVKLREVEVRNLLATARALRLTNQSRYRPTKAGTLASTPNFQKPWE
ncbi:hypothetical protein [Mesorhizobium sp. WSM4887]|uniref:hypothetical protein n=1 Tax=Mesorhizobium sp. WSM4887 TaxID=3038543 RepID=UPI002416B354|nr:hypothetical protein [Mesorhizobium sp. WSM4887]MDG4889285.1 hypothetical protein [Mesorhizobium sp. WSM4887]